MKFSHYSQVRFDKKTFKEKYMHYPDNLNGDLKPNGFWVSVDGKDDWIEFLAWNDIQTKCPNYRYKVGIDLTDIILLKSAFDIDMFSRDYGIVRHNAYDYIKWFDVSQKYKGIIIAPYIWERRLDGGSDWYYSWDCASGCIWDVTAIKSIRNDRKWNHEKEFDLIREK